MKALSLATDQASLFAPGSFPEIAANQDATLWIGLHFPSLALEVGGFSEGLPALVISQSGGNQVVHGACSVAMDHGIMPGMSLNAAHALCRNLAVKLRNPEAELQRLKQYSEQLLCFTPSIALGQWQSAYDGKSKQVADRNSTNDTIGPEHNTDSLLLEVSGCLRLFGGLEPLLERIKAEFALTEPRPGINTQPVVSVAPFPSAALLLARNGLEQVLQNPDSVKSALGEIPLRGADLSDKLLGRLAGCGLVTLRDLWRLPREDLGRRFGAPLLNYLDRLWGVQSDPLDHIKPTLCFRQFIELPADTRDNKLLLIAVSKLLEEARGFLQMHAAAAEKISFDLWHVNRAQGARSRTTLVIHSAEADRQPRRFLPQFEQQLARASMSDEVNAVSILIEQIVPYTRTSEDLFSGRDQQDQDWSQLIDLLGARLGQEKVYTLKTVEDHRPERAWQSDTTNQSGQLPRCHNTLPGRPLWLLNQPSAIDPVSFSLYGDTERIEAGWWERKDLRRDYHVARMGNGRCGWVYRDLRADKWYLHGLFA